MVWSIKGIVHFEINVLYVFSYLEGIQDVCVLLSTVFKILIFLGPFLSVSHTMEEYGVHLKDHAQRSQN